MPSSETGCSALSAGPSSISLWAAPEGIIGKQFSAWSTTTSRITALGVSIIQLDEIRERRGVAFGIAAAMQQFLPLPYHAHILVVQDERLHRQAVLGDR